MKTAKHLHVTDRAGWRAWLEKNHDLRKEVWLIYHKAHTRKPSIQYGDSVEEALCFGWIDGVIKRFDDEKYARKFTPRKKNSRWSELNKKRAEKMIMEGKMTDFGLARISEAKKSGEWYKASPKRSELIIPIFFKNALTENEKALEYFNTLSPTYKRHFVGWVSSAKREETRITRLSEAIKYLEQNKRLPLK